MYHYFRTPFPHNDHTEKLLVNVRAAAQAYLDTPIASLPYSKFMLFQHTGSRVEYEAAYIAHRRRLNVFTVMALAEPEEPRWLQELEDILWAVCDEYTWAFPAHLPAECPTEDAVVFLDLFSNETGGFVAEVLDLLGERLHGEVRRRAEYELRRRILEPFIQKKHRSFGKNNWAAVCGGNAASVVMRLGTPQEAAAAIAHADELMGDFLESYFEDGCCLEGALYWSYGFGYFCYYADMVRDYTGGEHNWFTLPKVRAIAEFRNKFYLQGNHVIPFADSSHDLNFHIGLAHFLSKEYDTIALPEEQYEMLFDDDPRHRSMELLRDFYWYDPTLQSKPLPATASYDLPQAQWCIRRKNGLVFAAKGGHNGEPHNHNDLGSFVLFDNGSFVLDDLGWPEYDKWYFGPRRSEYICSGSQGHSLPMPGGATQKSGPQYAASVLSWDEEHFCVDISGAYDLPGVTVQRLFTFTGGRLQVQDTFTGCKGKEITERFVTRLLPEQTGNAFRVGGWRLTLDHPCTTALSAQDFTPRLSCCKQNMKPVETAQLMDFICTPDADTWTVTMTVEKE